MLLALLWKKIPKMSIFQWKQVSNLPKLDDKLKLVSNNTKGFNLFSFFDPPYPYLSILKSYKR
jgi:hypothetical protein